MLSVCRAMVGYGWPVNPEWRKFQVDGVGTPNGKGMAATGRRGPFDEDCPRLQTRCLGGTEGKFWLFALSFVCIMHSSNVLLSLSLSLSRTHTHTHTHTHPLPAPISRVELQFYSLHFRFLKK